MIRRRRPPRFGVWISPVVVTILFVLTAVVLYETACRRPLKAIGPDYSSLRAQIEQFTAAKGATFGVYFIDLPSGKSFGINENEWIPAASTVKVPIALYLNELVAQGKVRWEDRMAYDSSVDYAGGAGALQFYAKDGDTYSMRVLSNLMITVSDNVAWRMLTRHLGKDNIADYMRGLGGETVYPNGENVTTAKDMAKYLQGVLDFRRRHPQLGERLIDDLAHTIWHVGLPGRLPAHLTVAHKEGDITGVADDVGIVFASRPYILVVLSKDVPDIEEGFRDIAAISKMVYDYQEKLGAPR